MSGPRHRPVLLEETIRLLAPRPGQRFLDMTLGGGGHTRRLLEAVGETGRVVGLDRDGELLAGTEAALRREGYGPDRFEARHTSFADIATRFGEEELRGFDGFLADLGVASPHFDDRARGFGFKDAGPLDMRFDRSGGRTLEERLGEWTEDELRRILKDFGEERYATRIARAVKAEWEAGRLTDTAALADTIRNAYPARARRLSPLDAATRSFQALRIAVNDELGEAQRGLKETLRAMRPGARLAVIGFHSLEDRLAKRLFRTLSEGEVDDFGHRTPVARELTRKPVRAGEDEVATNPRARSARLRVLEKTDELTESLDARIEAIDFRRG